MNVVSGYTSDYVKNVVSICLIQNRSAEATTWNLEEKLKAVICSASAELSRSSSVPSKGDSSTVCSGMLIVFICKVGRNVGVCVYRCFMILSEYTVEIFLL